ncbi:unnamed protein product [Heligmosomoides polygyrus]|uniref:BACK domain-containing protein n=1 Tax=Heligmosomoides polygyrus TaxID=6339 RepID=A0A183F8M4_HELPZ|nr:unnamed protein product [Heligmosomoides polygyrus]
MRKTRGDVMMAMHELQVLFATMHSIETKVDGTAEAQQSNVKKHFLTLNQEVVMKMLRRNTFSAAEIDIFKAVSEWIRAQTWTEGSIVRALVEMLLLEKCLHLDLISSKELLSTVSCSAIFAANSDTFDRFILDAFRSKYQDTVADMRGAVVLNQRVIALELGAAIVEGENRDALLKNVQGLAESTPFRQYDKICCL